MTKTEERFIEALTAFLRGEKVLWDAVSEAEWGELFQLAIQQKTLPMVVEAVYDCPAAEGKVLLDYGRQETIREVVRQKEKTEGFLALYGYLREKGFHPLVVKGILCRDLYPKKNHRPSLDEDLLIPEAEFAACNRAIRDYGMEPSGSDDPTAEEISWRSDEHYIEAHRTLFSTESELFGELNGLFSGVTERETPYSVESGRTVFSMPPREHLLYLLLHAYKHFIHSGFGVRQVCDIGLWAKTYEKEIDWDWLYALCEKSGTLYFTAAVFRMARDVFQIDVSLSARWNEVETDPTPMLSDLLAGGIHGANDLSRLHSSTVTLGAVEASRKAQKHSVLRSVFPSRERLEKTYPELREHPAKLPLVWVKRLWKYAKETKNTQNDSAAESLRIAKERTELLKYYHIVR